MVFGFALSVEPKDIIDVMINLICFEIFDSNMYKYFCSIAVINDNRTTKSCTRAWYLPIVNLVDSNFGLTSNKLCVNNVDVDIARISFIFFLFTFVVLILKCISFDYTLLLLLSSHLMDVTNLMIFKLFWSKKVTFKKVFLLLFVQKKGTLINLSSIVDWI